MFCDEKIKAVYELRRLNHLPGENAFFNISGGLAYYSSGGYWMVFETESCFITIGSDGVKKFFDKEHFPEDGLDLDDMGDEVFHSFESSIFVGETLCEVLKKDDYMQLQFDHFMLKLFCLESGERNWFDYRAKYGCA